MTLTIFDVKEGILQNLETWTSSGTAMKLYGLYYKGKLIPMGRARVYSQPGRAKAELINKFRHYIFLNGKYERNYEKGDALKVVNELLAQGILEIKEL